MKRPPRKPELPLFGKQMILASLLQGAGILLITLIVYLLNGKQGELHARTLTFSTLILANLGLILTNRSWSRTILATIRSPNRALWWIVGGSLLFLALVLSVRFLRDLFGFTVIYPIDMGTCLVAGVVGVLCFEGVKLFLRRGMKAG